jgi:hypothetical protein
MNNDVVYFSVNNWFCGRDYPKDDQFIKWLGNDLKQTFRDEEWVKENKLCVRYGYIDMSQNYCITAPREWVEKNCPKLLTDEEYEYTLISSVNGPETYKKKYSEFVYQPDEDGNPPEDGFCWPFLEYCDENIGCEYYEEPYESDFYDDEEEEDKE